LDWAIKYEVNIIWDLHAFMGGSSNGTYNGVWPKPPAFWTGTFSLGRKSHSLFEAGLWVAQALIKWIEGLQAERQAAIIGVSLMNEPAHLLIGHHWASKDKVFEWLSKSADLFRQSSQKKESDCM